MTLWRSGCSLYCKMYSYLQVYRVQDDLKLLDDRCPKLNGVVGNLIRSYEMLSLFDEKLGKWSNASCVPKKYKNKLSVPK